MKMRKILAAVMILAFLLSGCMILRPPVPDDRDDSSSLSESDTGSESGSKDSESDSSEEPDEPDSEGSESSESSSSEESGSEESSSEPEEDPAEAMLEALEGFWNDKESNLFLAFTGLAGEHFFTTGLWNSDKPESFHITAAVLDQKMLRITVHYPRVFDEYEEEWVEAWDADYLIDCSKIEEKEIVLHFGDNETKDLVYLGDTMESAYSYFEEHMASEIYGW